MKIRQLAALLLAVSISVLQPGDLIAVSEKAQTKKTDKAKGSTKSKKRKSGKSRKVTKKKGAKKKRRRKKKKVKKPIAKLGKFSIKGGAKSFKKSAENLINYMKETKTVKPSVEDKTGLWMSLARFYHYTEKVNAYKTEECNKIALNLFKEASQYKDLFSRPKIWLLEKWIKQKKENISVPEEKKGDSKKRVEKKVKPEKKVKKRAKVKKE